MNTLYQNLTKQLNGSSKTTTVAYLSSGAEMSGTVLRHYTINN